MWNHLITARSSQDIAIANIVLCMVYKEGVGGASYIAQQSCKSIAIVWAAQVGGGHTRMIDSCTKAKR